VQINGDEARLLVEALSGRWSYARDRRDKRNIWHYVADAFSILIDRLTPEMSFRNQPIEPIRVERDFDVRAPFSTPFNRWR
jgi:hypothetical protein